MYLRGVKVSKSPFEVPTERPSRGLGANEHLRQMKMPAVPAEPVINRGLREAVDFNFGTSEGRRARGHVGNQAARNAGDRPLIADHQCMVAGPGGQVEIPHDARQVPEQEVGRRGRLKILVGQRRDEELLVATVAEDVGDSRRPLHIDHILERCEVEVEGRDVVVVDSLALHGRCHRGHQHARIDGDIRRDTIRKVRDQEAAGIGRDRDLVATQKARERGLHLRCRGVPRQRVGHQTIAGGDGVSTAGRVQAELDGGRALHRDRLGWDRAEEEFAAGRAAQESLVGHIVSAVDQAHLHILVDRIQGEGRCQWPIAATRLLWTAAADSPGVRLMVEPVCPPTATAKLPAAVGATVTVWTTSRDEA